MKWFSITVAGTLLGLVFGGGVAQAQGRPTALITSPKIGTSARIITVQQKYQRPLLVGQQVRPLTVARALALARIRLGGCTVTFVYTDGVNLYLRARGLLYCQPLVGGPLVLCRGLGQPIIPVEQTVVNRPGPRTNPNGEIGPDRENR